MDDKTHKEVEAMLAEEREKMVKQQSLVSWLRAWLWLTLVAKKNAVAVSTRTKTRVRAAFWVRLRMWLMRPLRAWAIYKYAKLDEESRERVEDAWLTKTLDTLHGGPMRRGKAVEMGKAAVGAAALRTKPVRARMPVGSVEVDGDDLFVKAILGEV
jgi:hypothetical protein